MHVLPVITPRGSPNVGETIVELQPAIRIKVVLNLHNRRPVRLGRERKKKTASCNLVTYAFPLKNSHIVNTKIKITIEI